MSTLRLKLNFLEEEDCYSSTIPNDEMNHQSDEASYFGNCVPALITPTATQQAAQMVTPGSVSSYEERVVDVSPEKDMDRQLDEARWHVQEANEALLNLAQGIREVTRFIKRDTDEHTVIEAAKLKGVIGSDLLAFINAANMVREHARLASEEASVLVEDVQICQEEAQTAKKRADRAEKVTRRLYRDNVILKNEVVKLRSERRALAREVKSLREEVATTRKFDMWRLLEQHVVEAMQVHENYLKGGKQTNEDFAEIYGENNPSVIEANVSNDKPQENGTTRIRSCHENEKELIAMENKNLPVKEEVERTLTLPQSDHATFKLTAPKTSPCVDPIKSRVIGFGTSGFGGYAALGYGSRGKINRATQTASNQQPKAVSNASEQPQAKKDDDASKAELGNNANGDDDSAERDPAKASKYSPIKLSEQHFQAKPKQVEITTQAEDALGFRMKTFFSKGVKSPPSDSGRKSPTVSLDESTASCTQDSLSGARTPLSTDVKNEAPFVPDGTSQLWMPRDVTFQAEEEDMPSHLNSPAFTPETSPCGIGAPDLKPICDPNILRTLAIPAYYDDDEGCGNQNLPPPRTCVGPGLYEC
jgi:hypothetical protein